MNVKFTLHRQHGGPVDLIATVDSATTAGDLVAVPGTGALTSGSRGR